MRGDARGERTIAAGLATGGPLALVGVLATGSLLDGAVVGGATFLATVAAATLPAACTDGEDGSSGTAGSTVYVAELGVGVLLGVAVGAVVALVEPGGPVVATAAWAVGVAALWLASVPVRRAIPGLVGAPGSGRGVVALAAPWVALSAGAAVAVHAVLRLAGAGPIAVVAPIGVAVALPAGAATRLAARAATRVVARSASTSTRRVLGRANRVLVRVPVLDLPRLYRIVADPAAVSTIRLLVVVAVAFSLLYAASPLDAVPDVLVPVGWIDDVTVYVLLREVVYTGYDYETGVREAAKLMVTTRLKRLLVALAVGIASVLAAVAVVVYWLI